MSIELTSVFTNIAAQDKAAAHTDATRKEEGVTYTPPHIVREMINLLAPQWEESIHEPSCGRGMFAFGLVEYWLNQGKSAEQIAKWAQDRLFLCDIDSDAVADLKTIWKDFFLGHGVKTDTTNFLISDGLFGSYAKQKFDVTLGNPPYVRIQNLSDDMRVQIRSAFSTCKKGNVDLYYAFFEDALNRSKRACYIMPNSWFANKSAGILREKALPHVSALIDFGSTLIFAPVRAYTAIVLTGAKTSNQPIQVRGSLPSSNDQWINIARSDPRWGVNGWTPLLEQNKHDGHTLEDFAQVISGIATLSDKCFILPSPTLIEESGQIFVEQKDLVFEGHTLRVPIKLAPRIIKATRANQIDEKGPRILCPYDENWKLIDESSLGKQAPDLLSWLQRRKGILDKRDKGKTSEYEAWYAYGRRQGFWSASDDETVLLVPQMGNGKLTSIRVDLGLTNGRFLFTSGYVLRMKSIKDVSFLETQLGSQKAWDFVKREGKGWAGEGDYRTIGARSLRKLPLEPSAST